MPMRGFGQNQATVSQVAQLRNHLRAQAKDQAVAQKELVAEAAEAELFVDDVTGDVYKAYPVILTETDFTKTQNTSAAETTICSYSVPNGVEYLFRAPKNGMDRNSPYLYGAIVDKTTSTWELESGTIRIKILDASLNDLKGQPFVGSVVQLNNADAIDWQKRLFFNTRKPLRAKAGDYIQITLKATRLWDLTISTFFIQALELVKQ